jgi:hypothetical protein
MVREFFVESLSLSEYWWSSVGVYGEFSVKALLEKDTCPIFLSSLTYIVISF